MSTSMAIESKRPLGALRWRWFIAFQLIKLAAKIYGFKVEFYRSEEPHDRLSNR